MKQDFTSAATKRVYDTIESATAAPQTAEESKPKKRYKDRKTYTEAEEAEIRKNFKTSGRKGVKMRRINLSISEENYQYVKIMSRVRGESMCAFLNWMCQTHRDENQLTYNTAKMFLDNM